VICKICELEFEKKHFNQKLCSTECKKSSKSIASKKHKSTDKWQKSNKLLIASEKRKLNERRYRLKPIAKTKAVARSIKCLAKSPRLQNKKRERDILFSKTEKGKEINRAAKKKYSKTPKGAFVLKNIKHARRTIEKRGTLTEKEWQRILAFHKYSCAKCNSKERIEMDHIIPVSKGGQHSKENIQPLCRPCNASKGSKIWLSL